MTCGKPCSSSSTRANTAISCLAGFSLPTNAILYWNTLKITEIVDNLRTQGEDIDKEPLAHISLLSFRHVVPNGTYFIEDV